jgi:hypothetical protein
MRTVIYGALAALMLPYCKLSSKQTMANARNALIYGQCFGMVSGVVMMTELLRQAEASGQAQLEPVLCTDIPGNTTIEHLVNVVVKYGLAHPDETNERFEVLAFAALRDAWPCKR